MSKSYVRTKQGFKQNSNNNNNRKTKNNKSFNRKNVPRKYYNNNNKSNNNNNNVKVQKKKEINESPVKKEVCNAPMKKMLHFNEIVEVGYTHAPEEYDRTSIDVEKLTDDDIIEMLHLREQFKMETLEATRQRAIEESKESSPVLSNAIPSPTMGDLNMNLAVYASTSVGNSSLLTEVPTVTPSIISSPVLTPRNLEDEMISQKRKEIEYMIYQKQQMENSYLEALHYQKALQLIVQQQQQQLWKMYSQQAFIESELYLQQANSSIYNNINNVSPSMALWYAQDQYEAIPLMTQMEVM